MGNTWATREQHVGNTWATRGQHVVWFSIGYISTFLLIKQLSNYQEAGCCEVVKYNNQLFYFL